MPPPPLANFNVSSTNWDLMAKLNIGLSDTPIRLYIPGGSIDIKIRALYRLSAPGLVAFDAELVGDMFPERFSDLPRKRLHGEIDFQRGEITVRKDWPPHPPHY
jgi:hypothetical protein